MWCPLDETQMLEVHKKAMGRRLVQSQALGKVAEAQLGLVGAERTEDRGSSLEGLDPVLRLKRIVAPRRS